MKKIFTIFVFAILVASAVFVSAGGFDKIAGKNKGGADVYIPEHAVDLGNGLFFLGNSVDVNGEKVEGYMHVYKKEYGKPSGTPGGGKKGGGGSTCYSHLAKGARWKATENYVFEVGIDKAMMESSMQEWEKEVAFEIFGDLDTFNVTDGDDQDSPDGLNEVMHRPLGSVSTIAYTITWGIFGGPPQGRKLVEWDMVFNTNFDFGNAGVTNETNVGNTSLMDYQNIATHELGHALGMGHAPTDSGCSEETMYPTAENGETKKRTLNAGDEEGILKLYS